MRAGEMTPRTEQVDERFGKDEAVELAQEIRRLGPWFHNFNLNGVQTAPDHPLGDYPAVKWRRFAHALPARLDGMSVLDVGCNAGFHAIEMKKRGAAEVLGIDHDADYLRQARFAAAVLGHNDIIFEQMSVFDVALLQQKFDIVLFMGVFYHLRHPMLALDLLHEHVVNDILVFQTMQRGCDAALQLQDDYPISETGVFDQPGFPKLHFIEHEYAQDPTNWFIPNQAASEAMLRSSGFAITAHPEPEVYICTRVARPAWAGPVYPAQSISKATP